MDRLQSLVMALAVLLALAQTSLADVGPKPTADFQVTFNAVSVPDEYFSAVMLACGNFGGNRLSAVVDSTPQLNLTIPDPEKNCSWVPVWQAWTDSNPKGNCHNGVCSFWYHPPGDFKLAVYLPSQNKVFISNESTLSAFNGRLAADLASDGSITIVETPSALESHSVILFLIALPITLVLEVLAGLVFLMLAKLSKKILLYVFIANLISLPMVWFMFPLLGNIPLLGNVLLVIAASEAFAVVFEAVVIYMPNRKLITPLKAFLLSVIINAVSFFIGGAVFLLIYGFLSLAGLA